MGLPSGAFLLYHPHPIKESRLIVRSPLTFCSTAAEHAQICRHSFITDIQDVHDRMKQSLVDIPYLFSHLDNHEGIPYSHLTREAQVPQAQLCQEGIKGLSFSPLAKIHR